ncbi:type I-G CRISPR-associated helicase/endonuclease Cas3g [Steroidobacter gossypii]|uniref:type I-G CRISPR-associated helicase/endonuclease Cas3g n=1 Tax=Steroidobacter gossypii TaxID=2805490 RepID=UPI00193259E4|nr:type I-U CRISPR-associated helicase/endonuclease Cas3 [Steroidobacter gossypii]
MFDRQFEALTSFVPLSWQARLFRDYFMHGRAPDAIDIPTGLGKTAVMALWLIARANGAALPRRLVYVVDRRAVVDQASDFAYTLRERLDAQAAYLKAGLNLDERSLPISTLRGQYADNKEWLEDPSVPAIIVGTVDMVGSRMLFEGYGVSRRMRPYQAALLGTDALIVLDEAHLVPPFERLIEAITRGSGEFGPRDPQDANMVPALRLMSLSATGRHRGGTVFKLQGHLRGSPGNRGDVEDDIVRRRLAAEKVLTLIPKGTQWLDEALAAHAWTLSEKGAAPIRCLVFSNSRDIAQKARKRIKQLEREERARNANLRELDTELLIGARRVRERQSVTAEWLNSKGFVAGSEVERTSPAFLFATSAGEVGIDLDADHIVCDLVAWERLVQRFGRVNRRGGRRAKILIIDEGPPSPKKAGAPTLEETRQTERYFALRRLLNELPEHGSDSRFASPEALRLLRARADAEPALDATMKAATTPEPLRPALTRAVLDAWAMTSLETHTGRPDDVAPWLRGWVEQDPQTTIVWRRHLPVRNGPPITPAEIESYFEAAPPHLTEHLSAETFVVAQWLQERLAALLGKLAAGQEDEIAATCEEDLDGSETLSSNSEIAFALSQSGRLIERFSLGDFAIPKQDKERRRALDRRLNKLADAILIVDARVGGINQGLLDSDSWTYAETADGTDPWMASLNEQGVDRQPLTIGFRVRVVATNGRRLRRAWGERYRLALEWDADGVPSRILIVDKRQGDSANEEDRSTSCNYQRLSEHQSWTEVKARKLGERLGLCPELIGALALAARLHDEGKRSRRWQRAFRAPPGEELYAKTKGPIDFALLDGYRHEFGSLSWVQKDEAFVCLPEALKDLVLHLVAAHHGQARPVISTSGCEDAPSSLLQERARHVALRFARLQRRWGPWGLAWLESLLRAADQQASRDNDNEQGAACA